MHHLLDAIASLEENWDVSQYVSQSVAIINTRTRFRIKSHHFLWALNNEWDKPHQNHTKKLIFLLMNQDKICS